MAVTEQSCVALLDQLPVLGVLKRELRRSGVLPGTVPMTALAVLADGENGAEPIYLTTLAERLQIDPSVASRQVHQLIALDAVARVADPRDRRMHRLQVTQTGHLLLLQARQQAAAAIADQLTGWAEVDLATLTELLRRLKIDLGERIRGPGQLLSTAVAAQQSATSPEGSLS
ncbi:MAG: MarR family transcriptional regulator [Nakamurella sp.]